MTDKQKRQQITALFGAYSKRLEKLYDSFIQELSNLAIKSGVSVNDMLTQSPLYHFYDFPEIKQEYNRIFSDYVQKEMLCYRAGITDGVALAYSHYTGVLTGLSVLSDKALSTARKTAADAFLRSRLNTPQGLSLSQLVWNYASQTKSEFEVAVSNVLADGLKEGTSAADLAREVRQYLNNPDMMYRRYHRTVVDAQGNKKDIVRWRRRIIDDQGKVRFVEQPLEKVGMGHYRSSRKNSERLMRTEINSAYHTANYERWQKEPFVIGISIELSPEHPRYDECDELCGLWPKDTLFTGFHPQCMCSANPVTLQGEEKKEFYKRLAAGEDMSNYVSPNRVKDIPESAKKWIDENRDKFLRAAERGKLGYFWRNNMKYVGRQFNAEEQALLGYKTEKPKKRVKTEAEKNDIRRRWAERKKKNALIMRMGNNVLQVASNLGYVDTAHNELLLHRAIKSGNTVLINKEARDLARQIAMTNRQLRKMESLLVEPRLLARDYSITELKTTYHELDEVMNKWLAKYKYSSLETAPLDHLENKLQFELTHPSINYTYKDIVKDALNKHINLVKHKMELVDMIVKAEKLKTFKTKSPIYKELLSKIDSAIKKQDYAALQEFIAEAEKKQQKLIKTNLKKSNNIETALNEEYIGGVEGKDITESLDVRTMETKDWYMGEKRYTNNVAQMQGFDAPAKLVSEEEFATLENLVGEVFYRTVNPTTFNGIEMTAEEFASQMYKARHMALNGGGGRVHGDGIYTATSGWDGYDKVALSKESKRRAWGSSVGYGDDEHKVLEMTWTRKPKIITKEELNDKWGNLTKEQKQAFGNHKNTYACALGYDAMYCSGNNYMVIWNRSIIAVNNK